MTSNSFEAGHVADWLATVFVATGVETLAASKVAAALIDADLDGLPSHGVLQAPIYIRRLMAGSVSPASRGELVHESGAVAVYDGAVILGALAAEQAMDDAIVRARQFGISAVSVRRGFHFGAAGRYAQMASEAGLIGIAMCNSRAIMPAPGGAEPVVGNNPIAISVPSSDGIPLVLDMAMSQTSIGNIRVAASRGEQLQKGWALTADGEPTTDPKLALSGMLTTIAGPKGFGLALMVDLMSSLLAQGAGGAEVTSFYDNIETSAHCSFLFIAIDPVHFGLEESLGERAAVAADAIRNSRKRADVDRIYTPGERRWERRDKAKGRIVIGDRLFSDLNAIAADIGVPPLNAAPRA